MLVLLLGPLGLLALLLGLLSLLGYHIWRAWGHY